MEKITFFMTKVRHSVGQQRCEVFVLKEIKLLVISVKEGLMTCFKGWVWVGMCGFYMGLASISSQIIYQHQLPKIHLQKAFYNVVENLKSSVGMTF